MPRDMRRRDVAPVAGDDARVAAVQLRERDEVRLLDARRRRGHDAAVELAEISREPGPARAGEVEAVALAPRVRAKQEAAVAREAPREAAGGEHERRLGVRGQRCLELDVAGEQSRERARVVAAAGRERVLGVAPERLGAERLEPCERVVEPLPDEALQPLVSVGGLGAERVPLEMPPDHARREQHRPAGARPLLEHPRRAPELAQPRRGHEPSHPAARDSDL